MSLRVDREKLPEQVEIARNWIAAFNAHNVAALVALYAPEAELYDAGMKQARRGIREIESWFTQRFMSLPEINYTPTDEIMTGEIVAVTWTVRGRTPRLLGLRWLARPFAVDGVS
ncbi:MAG: nuclear transport factor 2 family protein, partial [Ktedonobacteraceae bacterium]